MAHFGASLMSFRSKGFQRFIDKRRCPGLEKPFRVRETFVETVRLPPVDRRHFQTVRRPLGQ